MAFPRFSVITPVLNGANDVHKYVETLKSQTFTDWESIVIDDGSTDATLCILKECIAGDHRFRIEHNTLSREVPGPYQARNIGLRLATGDFVCFLDIDDIWFPCKLEIQDKQLNLNSDIRLLYSSYIRANRGSPFGKVRKIPFGISPKLFIKLFNPIPMLTSCVARQAIAELRFTAHNHEDYIFWHSVLKNLRPYQIKSHSRPLAIYCVHSSSVSSNKLKAAIWIWRCYEYFGYGVLVASLMLILRGILQVLLNIKEFFTPRVNLKDFLLRSSLNSD